MGKYKTHSHPISIESRIRNTKTAKEICRSNKIREFKPMNRETENRTISFEEILLESIDEVLSLLGESSKQAIYSHLEKAFNINRLNIPYRIEGFVDALEKIFGAGAKILEIQIMKLLFKKIGCNFKHYPKEKNLTFIEYLTAIKLEKENYENTEEQKLNLNWNPNEKKIIHLRIS